MVHLAGVTKHYDGQSRVLEQVNLELKKGEFIYVVGGSGAGKTTLLRLLATEEAPSQGSVSLFGYSLNSVSASTLRNIRRALGYVPQNVRLIGDLSVFDNVAMSLALSGRKAVASDQRSKINHVLERLGLASKKEVLASALSGGESQRVAVARALVRSPELIIADEPTGAQDNEYTWSMMDLFQRANLGGSTVVVATHDREIVNRVRKRCAVLRGGNVQFEGAAALCI